MNMNNFNSDDLQHTARSSVDKMSRKMNPDKMYAKKERLHVQTK
jgi:hypothetical protein